MRRREVIALLGGVAAWPGAARGQTQRRVGVVIRGGPYLVGVEGLREGLQQLGLEETRNLALLVADATGDLTAVETAARAMERDGVEVIVAFATSVALAARHATARVPIVFSAGSDPVSVGLVESIPRPAGRLTGVHNITTDLTEKRLEILTELVPVLRRVLTYYNPANPSAAKAAVQARDGAQKLGIELIERHVATVEQLKDDLDLLRPGDADAYFFLSDSMVNSQDAMIIARANALRLPTMAIFVDPVTRGALAAYGIGYRELGRRTAAYVKRILDGTPPRDLPVEAVNRPTLALNLKTAKLLGLTVSPTLLARADEVIE